MKSLIYIFTFLLFSTVLSAQDATKTNYKNQIGTDLKPLINNLTGEGWLLYELDLLYRREINKKNWGMIKLGYVTYAPTNQSNTFIISDSTYVENSYIIGSSIQLELNYSRKFLDNEKISLYYGATASFRVGDGATYAHKYLQNRVLDQYYTLGPEVFEREFKSIAIGPSFSVEWKMSKRMNLLTNINVLVHKNIGIWTYLDGGLNRVTDPFNEKWSIDKTVLSDIALMYNF